MIGATKKKHKSALHNRLAVFFGGGLAELSFRRRPAANSAAEGSSNLMVFLSPMRLLLYLLAVVLALTEMKWQV